jgi:hypothetical protein
MTEPSARAMLSRMRPTRRLVGGLRHLLPVALCALGGHLALYRTLMPSAGEHAYFAWYEPLVAGLSVAALVAFAVMLLAALLGRESLRRAVVRVLLPATARPVPGTVRGVRLALASIAFLVVQETIERTLAEGHAAAAAFGPSQLLLVLAVVAVLAALVALVERSCSQLIALVARPRPRAVLRLDALPFPVARPLLARRRHPLAELRGLRAPPLAV